MSHYFEHTPDLSNSILTVDILERGRSFYRWLLRRLYGDSLFRPGAVFGVLWNKQQYAPGYGEITTIALVLQILYRHTEASQHLVLDAKIRKFFSRNKKTQFDEDFNEFRIGAMFGVKLGKLELEPLANKTSAADQGQSPDFMCHTSTGLVFIESTTLRVGPIQTWSEAVDGLQERLLRFLQARNLWRRVIIKTNLDFNLNVLSRKHWLEMCAHLEKIESGEVTLRESPTAPVIRLEIEPIAIESAGFRVIPGAGDGAFLMNFNESHQLAWASQVSRVPPLETAWLDLLESNLSNVIKNKKKQFKGTSPAVLGITLGFKVYGKQQLFEVTRDIFRPGKHSWLAGIVFLMPGTGTDTSSTSDEQVGIWNPYATVQISDEISALFGSVSYTDVTPPSATPPDASSLPSP